MNTTLIVDDPMGEKVERGALLAAVTKQATEGWRGGTPIDLLQDRLYDRALPFNAEHMVVAIVACMGEAFANEDNPEAAVEALGMAMVHAAALAALEHLAVGPILDFAGALSRRPGEQTLRGAGKLATSVLWRAKQIAKGRTAHVGETADLVDGIGMSLAKAIDDCEIMHDVTIDPKQLFVAVAKEVLGGRRPTHQTMHGVGTAPRAPGDAPVVHASDGTTEAAQPIDDHAVLHAPALDPAAVDAAAQIRVSAGVLTDEAAGRVPSHEATRQLLGLEPPKPFDLSEVHTGPPQSIGEAKPYSGPIAGLDDINAVCPHCAAPMSLVVATLLLRCENDHEWSRQDIQALEETHRRERALNAAPPPESTIRDTQPITRAARLKPVPPRDK